MDELMDRNLYRKIKGMRRAELEQTLKNMYQLGYDEALKNGTVDFNIDKIQNEISEIKGIGEVKLAQIMEVIKNNLN